MAFTDEQRLNAATIIRVGQQVGASQRDILIGLMTAMQESSLINIHGGDRDSQGLFQQRPSMGWGTIAQVTDPEYAARTFFKGKPGNPGLFSLKNRDQMSLTAAAQAVQRSAYPDAYAKHESGALDLLGGSKGLAEPSPTGVTFGKKATPATPPPPVPLPPGAVPPPAAPTSYIDTAPPPPEQAALTDPAGLAPTGPAGLAEPAATTPGIAPVMEAVDPAAYAPPAELPVVDMDAFTTEYLGPITNAFGADGKIATGRGADLVSFAQGFIGVPYVWGGNGREGVDCSGLVQQVFRAAGIELPRVSSDQARAGARIGLDALQPGDLVAWDNSPRNAGADHIAIYAGNGMIIEAPRPGLNVRTRKLDDYDSGAWGVRLTKGT